MRRSTVLSLSLSVSVPLLDSKNTLAYQSKEMYNINSQSGVSALKLLIDASFIIDDHFHPCLIFAGKAEAF
jgi:hypothetical protein